MKKMTQYIRFENMPKSLEGFFMYKNRHKYKTMGSNNRMNNEWTERPNKIHSPKWGGYKTDKESAKEE